MTTHAATVTFDKLDLDCGSSLAPIDCAYETYGELNADKSNAILVEHAFSGDAHAAGPGGWWSNMIMIVPYDSTRFRIALTGNGDQAKYAFWSTSFYAANADLSLQLQFEIWK